MPVWKEGMHNPEAQRIPVLIVSGFLGSGKTTLVRHLLREAQVSGARLLYSNDRALQGDFKNRRLIDNPRGRVYSTRENKRFTESRKRLLRRNDLCAGSR